MSAHTAERQPLNSVWKLVVISPPYTFLLIVWLFMPRDLLRKVPSFSRLLLHVTHLDADLQVLFIH